MAKSKNEEKKLTQGEVLDGCSGCLSFGCLPFSLLTVIIIVMIFLYKDTLHNVLFMIYNFIF